MRSSRVLISMERIIPEDEIKEAFLSEERVYEIIRLSLINDYPYALQKTYIPCSVFDDAERFDFENGSLYDYMQDLGHSPTKMVSYLRIDKLPEEYRSMMSAGLKNHYFVFDYYGYDVNGILVEYTLSYHHPKYTTFKYKTSIHIK